MSAVNILAVLFLCSPILAEPYFYSVPWQSQNPNFDRFQENPKHQPQYHQLKPVISQIIQRPTKVYTFVVPYQNNAFGDSLKKPVTYQQVYRQKTPKYLQQGYQNQEIPQTRINGLIRQTVLNNAESEYAPNNQMYKSPPNSLYNKPFTSYDAPIHHVPDFSPHQSASEYQSFLNDIAPQNGINFDLQGHKQDRNKDTSVFRTERLEPDILKVLHDLLLKEEIRNNEEELKHVPTAGVPLSSYGVPVNHRKVIGVELEPLVRGVTIGEVTI